MGQTVRRTGKMQPIGRLHNYRRRLKAILNNYTNKVAKLNKSVT